MAGPRTDTRAVAIRGGHLAYPDQTPLSARATASLSFSPFNLQTLDERSQMRGGFVQESLSSAQDSWQCFTFEGQICSLRGAFTKNFLEKSLPIRYTVF